MDQRQRTKRFGKALILAALLARLLTSGFPAQAAAWLAQENILSFLIYLETGRNVRFLAPQEDISDFFRESPPPQLPQPAQKPSFTQAEGETLAIYNTSSKEPEVARLLQQPLSWNLKGEEPTVLILHTHTTESYTKEGEDYEESSAYRTLEEDHNMLYIGSYVVQLLKQGGVNAVQDRTVHDYPSYNGSYVHARKTLEEQLAQYPSIQLVLDLHRDAGGTASRQLRTEVLLEGEPAAQLMLVMGTNYAAWEENLSLGLKLQAQLERQCPGLTRPLCLRGQRFNQDLCPGALLVEVGAAGNTRKEALLAAQQLAQAILALAEGTEQSMEH